jgi:hypothetical protein
VLWPSTDAGVVSIYCPSIYAVGQPRGFHLEDRGWRNWTAQALIFSNPAARGFIADLGVVNHRHHGRREGMRNIDCVVGHWCRQAGRPFYVHAPSLAQHVGEASTLYPRATASGRRSSSTFVGEDFDARPWLSGDPTDSSDERESSLHRE